MSDGEVFYPVMLSPAQRMLLLNVLGAAIVAPTTVRLFLQVEPTVPDGHEELFRLILRAPAMQLQRPVYPEES